MSVFTVPFASPYRLISRLASEFHLTGSRLALRLSAGGLDEAVVAMVLLRASLPAWHAAGRLGTVGGQVPVGTISAIARSIDRSPETVRRLVYKLREQGFCAVGQRGLLLTPNAQIADRCIRYLKDLHDFALWMAEQMLKHHILKEASSSTTMQAIGEVQREMLVAALDMSLLPFETFRLPEGDWTTMVLWNTLSTMTVRHINEDPVRNREFAFQSTPDEQRKAFSLRHVARVAGISYATAWRHIQTLERHSLAQRRGDKWFVSAGALQADRLEASVIRNADYFVRRLRIVASMGLTMESIHESYLSGRPSLLPI